MFNESAKISGNVSISNQVWTTKGHKGYTKDTKNELKSASLDRRQPLVRLTAIAYKPSCRLFPKLRDSSCPKSRTFVVPGQSN